MLTQLIIIFSTYEINTCCTSCSLNKKSCKCTTLMLKNVLSSY